ncbi:MAG: hypothetical protein ACYDBH_01065 [Acidobacteriaceae bacterium]
MKIDDKYRIVIPIGRDSAGNAILNVYSTPISREVFEANYRILSATHAALLTPGLAKAAMIAPRIASLRLRDEGARDAADRGEEGDSGASALLAEIKRLTLLLTYDNTGWNMFPVDAAIAQGVIDGEDWREVESALVFFTCSFYMVHRRDRKVIMETIAEILRGSITSFEPMEYAASLQTSTQTKDTMTAT